VKPRGQPSISGVGTSRTKAPQVPRIGQDGEGYGRTYTGKSLEGLKLPPSLRVSLQERKSDSLNLTPERSQDIRNLPH
jgi:hypothetical protein